MKVFRLIPKVDHGDGGPIFFLVAVSLYLDVSRTSTERVISGLDEGAYTDLLENGNVTVSAAFTYRAPDPQNPDVTVERWDVTDRSAREPSQVAEDLARQLVTVLGTLIVAIAAFYFGANSVEAAKSVATVAVGGK